MASVSSAHEWRQEASSQTSSTILRPRAIEELPKRLLHLGPEAMVLVCHAAGQKGPIIPVDCFGGASNAFHTRQVLGRLHGHHWPRREKQYFSAHVTLSRSAGYAPLKQVRGVTRDQQGPRPSQNRSLISAARAHDSSQRSMRGSQMLPKFQLPPTRRHPPSERGNLGVELLHGAH